MPPHGNGPGGRIHERHKAAKTYNAGKDDETLSVTCSGRSNEVLWRRGNGRRVACHQSSPDDRSVCCVPWMPPGCRPSSRSSPHALHLVACFDGLQRATTRSSRRNRRIATGCRARLEAVAYGICAADYGADAVVLMGLSAARLHGAVPRALAVAVVAVGKNRPNLTLGDRDALVVFVRRETPPA